MRGIGSVVTLALIAMMAWMPLGAHAQSPLHVDFGSVPGATISFPGDTTFSFADSVAFFPPGVAGYDFWITGQSGFTAAPGLSGLTGKISGTYTIGNVTTTGTISEAPVTGAGTLTIFDGTDTFSANLEWVNIVQVGTGDTLNTEGQVNLSGFSYTGTNPNLLEMAARPNGVVTATFQFVPAVTLDQLKTTSKKTTYSGSIAIPAPLEAACVSQATGQVDTPYSAFIAVSGGVAPYAFEIVSGSLPNGLTLNASTGEISGIPTTAQISPFVVQVTDSTPGTANTTMTPDCGITIVPRELIAACVAQTTGRVGVGYSSFIQPSGGTAPFTFQLNSGSLPDGLTLDASTGQISGTPTAAGAYPFTVLVTDSTGTGALTAVTPSCGITIAPPPTADCVAIEALAGVAITPVTLSGSGGAGGPYTFGASGLPAGLTMSPDGTISGTPSVSGTFAYTATVTDNNGNTGTVTCSVTVNAPPSANCVVINAVEGHAITPVTMVGTGGTGGPYTFSATGLPAGLTMSADGTISGTPSVSGTFLYSVTVTDKDGNTGTFNCSVNINTLPGADCIAITAVNGTPIAPLTLSGYGGAGGPYTFSATGLPAGLTMSSSGTISGTPTVSGMFTYSVTVTDKNGNTGAFTCSIQVNSPPDTTPPVCAVYGSANPPYMTYQDFGSGIVRLDVTKNLNTNYNITISPTPAGTTFSPAIPSQPYAMPTGTVVLFPAGVNAQIKVSATRISTSKSAQLIVKATDAFGHTVTCDPVETTVTKLKQDEGNQTFTDLPYEEHIVTVENGGLRAMEIIVNGTVFKVNRLSDNEVWVVDVRSAMLPGNNNTITLVPKGKKGESADVTIGAIEPDEAENVLLTSVTKLKKDKGDETYTGVALKNHIITIENDGLDAIIFTVNGTEFPVRNLKKRETYILNVRSAMVSGKNNTITLSPRGKKGDSASVTIGPRAVTEN